jgi:hypothetical protein
VSENSPADFVAVVALNLLDSTPTRRERATAELLQHLVETWEQQPAQLRKHAVSVAGAFSDGPLRGGWSTRRHP